jgi:hypothetical protein
MMEEQTTRLGDKTELQGLLDIISDQRQQLEMKQKRVEYLEFVLAERMKATRNRYAELKPYFETLQKEVLKIFLELPAAGLTYQEIYQEFHQKYPNVNTVNLLRRIRELVEQKKLWTSPDPVSGKIRFYLKLDKTEEKEEHGA